MAKFVMLIVLGGFISFGIISISQNNMVSQGTANAVKTYSSEQARSISESMAQMIISQLADSSDWRVTTPVTKGFFGGSAAYTIKDTVISPDSLIKISIASTYNGVQNNLTVYTNKITGGQLPPFLNYAILTNGNLTMKGNALVEANPPGNYNANVHTNGAYTGTGNSYNLNGFLTYNSGSGKLHATPPSNPNNLLTYSTSAQVTIPTFNPANFLSKATTVYNGNTTLSGTITMGTKTNPAIIYVGGNATINNANFTGYGSIIVTGDISMAGNNSFSASDPQGNPLGLFTAGNFSITGNSNVYASIFANGTVSLNGTGSVYGQIIQGSSSSMTLSGTSNVYYIPPISSITNTFWPSTGTPLGFGFDKNRLNVKYWYE
jgi:hypothetical protein